MANPAFELIRYPYEDGKIGTFHLPKSSPSVKVNHTVYDQDLTRDEFLGVVTDFMRACGYYISDNETLDIYEADTDENKKD